MSGIKARRKGQNGEREIIRLLQPIVDERYATLSQLAVPDLERNQNQSNKGGYDIIGLDWIALEIKRQEKENLSAWWEQTKKQAKHNQHPVLIYRANNQPWRVMLEVSVYESNQLLVMPAQINLDNFLQWFKIKLTSNLLNNVPLP